ncbi:MAG: tetratricopeptide repeat protein [Pseudomonadota bacterium]
MEAPAIAPAEGQGLMRWLAVLALLALAACGPSGGPPSVAQTQCFSQEDATAEAVNACTRYLAETDLSDSARADALAHRADLRIELGQTDAALADYAEALRLNPNQESALMGRSRYYRDQGDFGRAVADLDTDVRLHPDSAFARYQRSQIYDEGLHDYERAIADLNRAIDLSPNVSYLLNARCWVRAKAKRALDLALADCNSALERTPNSPDYLDSRGLVHLQLGEFQAAFGDFDAAVQGNKFLAHSLYGRGFAALRLGRADEGRADMAAAATSDDTLTARYAGYGLIP